ncbi:MAG: hypothetical protein ACR2P2_06010, partial [Nakamurella sp.]
GGNAERSGRHQAPDPAAAEPTGLMCCSALLIRLALFAAPLPDQQDEHHQQAGQDHQLYEDVVKPQLIHLQ